MLVRPVMKRLFCLKANNDLGRLAPSTVPQFKILSLIEHGAVFCLKKFGVVCLNQLVPESIWCKRLYRDLKISWYA